MDGWKVCEAKRGLGGVKEAELLQVSRYFFFACVLIACTVTGTS